jgi:hypothetical protein
MVAGMPVRALWRAALESAMRRGPAAAFGRCSDTGVVPHGLSPAARYDARQQHDALHPPTPPLIFHFGV